MVVTFCGHSSFQGSETYEKEVLEILEEKIGEQAADLYLGGYGEFDRFAYTCCKKYKKTHKNVSLIFVTPYLTVSYQQNKLRDKQEQYDSILYPEIETKPPRLAILYRNRFMIEKADLVIAFVEHSFGGAYQTYQYAIRKKKPIINLSKKEF